MPQNEIEQLRAQTETLATALHETRRELMDARSRLVLIGAILDDRARILRAPGVAFGAVSAALHAEWGTVRRLTRSYAARRSGS